MNWISGTGKSPLENSIDGGKIMLLRRRALMNPPAAYSYDYSYDFSNGKGAFSDIAGTTVCTGGKLSVGTFGGESIFNSAWNGCTAQASVGKIRIKGNFRIALVNSFVLPSAAAMSKSGIMLKYNGSEVLRLLLFDNWASSSMRAQYAESSGFTLESSSSISGTSLENLSVERIGSTYTVYTDGVQRVQGTGTTDDIIFDTIAIEVSSKYSSYAAGTSNTVSSIEITNI